MLLAGAGRVFMGFILYISGVSGRTKSICALKGSSVDLLCSTEVPTSSNKWFTVHSDGYTYILNEISVDGHRVTSNMSDKSQPTLTIKDLTESDANRYCCSENTDSTHACLQSVISLQVADLQVKVIPATEEQTVTLRCSSSCPLTENPAAYIWYKNRELLYQDWSPWYQELVSSEEAVRYSCAVKGYEELRAPEVSVDSVTPTCINVTYAKGRMCEQTSVDESCSITYPTEIRLQRTSPRILTCTTSCPLTDPQTVYSWYWNRQVYSYSQSQLIIPSSAHSLSCAVKGLKDLLSPEVCIEGENCWSVNYASRRICALQGSSVDISSKYTHPNNQQPQFKQWYKIKRNGEEAGEELITAAGRVQYHEDRKKHHTLTIKQLKKNDSAEYMFRLQTPTAGKQFDPPGVTLVVTDLRVRLNPAVVTEGQRVTLTCITSCPLSVGTTYTWYLNRRPLTLPQGQNKHLVLDPVSSQHAGSYSCAVITSRKSNEKTLTVQSIRKDHGSAAAAGASAALLVIIPLIGVVVFFWIRRRNSSQSLTTEATENTEQLNPGPVYESISAQPAEQDDFHYSTVLFSKTQTDPLYCTVQPHQPEKEDHATYTAVSFRPNTTPE
ncbi:cell adhesion molecule CEACAM1-like isoform X2 [Trachinotus anak]|uniref:cell adhesion molecule CEACAM1-like isoform X2 n=1 Tax=Trachinotus anak TaxID=443729 RepID=UPI0039F21254